MTSLNLDKVLTGHVFGFLFIFCRMGAAVLLLPGFGETYVSPRLRLLLGLSLSFLLVEPMLAIVPPLPPDIPGLARLLGIEIVVGLFFGSLTRLIMSTLETVGSMIAMQTGLSNAVILNPALATQSPLPSAFLSVVGVTLIFVTGLDHFLIRSLIATYNLFPPGESLLFGDMAQSFIHTFNRSFMIGIELAAPFMVIGLLSYVALGIMQRLLPQVQLFLIMLPVQIWGGLFLLAITVSMIMALWLQYFDQSIAEIFGGSKFGR